MTHEYAGKYAEKHQGKKLDKKIAVQIKEKETDNSITCAQAHRIVENLNVAPLEVGTAIDLLNVRIKKCQLGLFGNGMLKAGASNGNDIDTDLRQAVEASLINNRLPCLSAWEISDRLNIAKTKIGALCQLINVKISTCQLGAFK